MLYVFLVGVVGGAEDHVGRVRVVVDELGGRRREGGGLEAVAVPVVDGAVVRVRDERRGLGRRDGLDAPNRCLFDFCFSRFYNNFESAKITV